MSKNPNITSHIDKQPNSGNKSQTFINRAKNAITGTLAAAGIADINPKSLDKN